MTSCAPAWRKAVASKEVVRPITRPMPESRASAMPDRLSSTTTQAAGSAPNAQAARAWTLRSVFGSTASSRARINSKTAGTRQFEGAQEA